MPNNDNDASPKAIGEDVLWAMTEGVLDTLLLDHTTGRKIFWATHDYEAFGPAYDYHSPMLPELITGEHEKVVRPRLLKSKERQTDRSKDMAEVFTPSWICNAQNNLVDEAWWAEDGKTWEDYVRSTRLEITCGEAPYLVSRYDTTTGDPIALQNRIGLLDRKLHIISENVADEDEWLKWAKVAYQNTYGYEWQGDNLLLARRALLFTFIEYYQAKFSKQPSLESIRSIADTISWNLWQMDGLTGGIPGYVPQEKTGSSLFDDFFLPEPEHRYCRIFDWEKNEEVRFIDLIK
ncbi:MAG: restriction endonuclease subunit M [Prevotella sp.]|nr:restriction endonuclease subunit M [Prevotella sp.]